MQTKIYNNVDETIYTEVLNNGLKVCLLPKMDISETSGIFTTDYGANDISFVPIGKSNKFNAPQGVAHFLEHKLFDKGDHDVFSDFSKLGASANAYTNPTQTAYMFDTTENIGESIELLLDFVQDPYFTDKTVEKEKGIITQEAQMYADSPDQLMYMGTLEAIFKNHPVRNEVLGTIDSINNITKEDLYTCYHTFYHPSNMTLSITGNFDPQEIMSLIRKNQSVKQFENPEAIQRFAPEEPSEVAQSNKTITVPVSTSKCMVGMKEYSQPIGKDELLKRALLTGMVLDYLFGRSGPFYKKLYEQGLVDYSFGYQNACEHNYGYSLIHGNTNNPESFAKFVKELLTLTNTLQLQEKELERMKKRKIGRILRGMNSTVAIAQNYTWYDNHGLNYFELIPAIQKFTLGEVNSFINDWIDADRLAVCTVVSE